jgi:hypothetical protein
MNSPDAETLKAILDTVRAPFWAKFDFWWGTVIGVLGLGFSAAAFVQARRAAREASKAARSVKIQTVTMELQEVWQKLSGIRFNIGFETARMVLTEASSRIRRHTIPFQQDSHFRDTITEIRTALRAAWTALDGVRPNDPSKEVPNAVFNAIDSSFSRLVELISDLLGLMETETLAFGDDDDDHAPRGSAPSVPGRTDSSEHRGED